MDNLCGQDTTARRPKRRFLSGCLLLVGLLVLVAAGGWYWVGYSVSARLAQIRAAGEPVTLAELDAYYAAPPSEEDCTRLLLDAFGALNALPADMVAKKLPFVGEGGQPPDVGSPWDQLEEAELLLAKYDGALKTLHEVRRRGGRARFPLDLSGPLPALDVRHAIQDMRHAYRLLQLEANARAHRGDIDGAVESINTILVLIRSLETEPVLVSQTIRGVLQAVAISEIVRLLGTAEVGEEELAHFQDQLRSIDHHASLYRGLVGERCFFLELMIDSAGTMGPAYFALHLGLPNYIRKMQEVMDASKLPWPEALAEIHRIRASVGKGGSPFQTTSKLTIPSLEAFFRGVAASAARCRVGDAIIAAERFRKRNGRWPAALQELVPDLLPTIPMDPFTGAPLLFKVSAGELVIYSVGVNGRDGGGASSTPESQKETDIVYRLKR